MRTSVRFRVGAAGALTSVVVATGLVGAPEAVAKVPGANGSVAFTGYDDSGTPYTAVIGSVGETPTVLPIGVPNGDARWSPDGAQLLMFTFTELGFRPGISNADGSNLTVLAVPALPDYVDLGPCVWMPSGTRILCKAADFSGTDSSLDGIYSIATDGSDPVRLTTNPYPPSGEFGGGDIPGDVSPDGQRFVFMRARPDQPQAPGREQSGALFVENTDGSGLQQITDYGLANSHDETSISWSPDGTTILFGSAQGALFTIRPDGSALARVPLRGIASASFAAAPSWSPDGQQIAFKLCLLSVRQCDVYTVDADGRGLTRVTTSGGVDFPDWGPATD